MTWIIHEGIAEDRQGSVKTVPWGFYISGALNILPNLQCCHSENR